MSAVEGIKTFKREPDSEFVRWLKYHSKTIGTELRCRWNPQRQRWVIDERNLENGLWNCILVWETDDGHYCDLNRDLAIRLQLNSWKYNQMIISPKEYLLRLNRQAESQIEKNEQTALDETVYCMMQDKKAVRQLYSEFEYINYLKEKAAIKAANRDKKLILDS